MTELNLLPPYLKEKSYKRFKFRNYVLLGFIGLSMVFILFYVPLSALYRIRYEEASWIKGDEEAKNAMVTTENEKIKKEIEIYRQYIENVELLTRNKTLFTNRVGELEKYIPSDMIFESLVYGEKSLTLKGTASSIDSISKFTSNIQSVGFCEKVRISSIITQNGASGNFDIGNKKTYEFIINTYGGGSIEGHK